MKFARKMTKQRNFNNSDYTYFGRFESNMLYARALCAIDENINDKISNYGEENLNNSDSIAMLMHLIVPHTEIAYILLSEIYPKMKLNDANYVDCYAKFKPNQITYCYKFLKNNIVVFTKEFQIVQ